MNVKFNPTSSRLLPLHLGLVPVTSLRRSVRRTSSPALGCGRALPVIVRRQRGLRVSLLLLLELLLLGQPVVHLVLRRLVLGHDILRLRADTLRQCLRRQRGRRLGHLLAQPAQRPPADGLVDDADAHEAPARPRRDGVPELAAAQHLQAARRGLDPQAELPEDQVAALVVADGHQEGEAVVPVARVLVLVGHEVDQQGPHQEGLARAPGLDGDAELRDLVRDADILLEEGGLQELEEELGDLGAGAEGAVAQVHELVEDVAALGHPPSGVVFGGAWQLMAVRVTNAAVGSDVEEACERFISWLRTICCRRWSIT